MARGAVTGAAPQSESRSTNRRIFAAAAVVAVASAIAKAASLGKDLVVANRFGTSDAVDAFVMALLLPTFVINVAANSLSTSFVAIYIEVREKRGEAAANDLFRNVVALGLGVLLALTVVLGVSMRWLLPLLATNFGPDKLAATRLLFFLLLPAVALSGLASLYSGVLNAGQRFAAAAVAPTVIPLLGVVAVLFWGESIGVEALAIGTVAGYLVQVVVVARATVAAGAPIMPRWQGLTPELRQVLGQYAPVTAAAVLMSSTVLVDQAMASSMPPGSVAALNYGNKITALLTNLGTMALGTAVLPHFAVMVATHDWAKLRTTIRTWSAIVLATTLPTTALLFALSPLIIRGTFQHGAFTAADTATVSAVQRMYLLQLPFYTLGILFVRVLTAVQQNRVLLWGTAISFPLNAVGNIVLMRWLGVSGVALSTSLVYVVSCVYLGLMLRRALRGREESRAAMATDLTPAGACP